jgi:hypothetical protein
MLKLFDKPRQLFGFSFFRQPKSPFVELPKRDTCHHLGQLGPKEFE